MLTQEYLKSILYYDPDWGIFTWLINGVSLRIGDLAGYKDCQGYWIIIIRKKRYRAHRLAFLYMTGKWPENDVDHEDTIKHNNAWANIRPATDTQNKHNRGRYKNNKLGVKGVCLYKGKYQAKIQINKNVIKLGLFSTLKEAKLAYEKAALEHHKEFARF